MPPASSASESDQSRIAPPALVRLLFNNTFPVAFKVIGAILEVFALMFAPVVMSPAVAVTAMPDAPAEVIEPDPLKLSDEVEIEPLALSAPAPE